MKVLYVYLPGIPISLVSRGQVDVGPRDERGEHLGEVVDEPGGQSSTYYGVCSKVEHVERSILVKEVYEDRHSYYVYITLLCMQICIML